MLFFWDTVYGSTCRELLYLGLTISVICGMLDVFERRQTLKLYNYTFRNRVTFDDDPYKGHSGLQANSLQIASSKMHDLHSRTLSLDQYPL